MYYTIANDQLEMKTKMKLDNSIGIQIPSTTDFNHIIDKTNSIKSFECV